MEQPESLRRHVHLDVSTERLWELISDPAELAGWLGETVDVEVRPGAAGLAVDDGVIRHLHLDRIDEGRSLAFTWWEPGRTDRASQVEFEITPVADGGSRLDITETMCSTSVDTRTSATASVDAAQRQARWETRVCLLWACTVVAALVA